MIRSTMERAAYQIFTVVVIFYNTLPACHCATDEIDQEVSLADNYTALTDDIRWFFRGAGKFAATIEQMLPNVTTDVVETRTFSENTRITFLMGLHHLMVGIREIAMTIEQSFKTDHIKQMQQLKNATNFVHKLIIVIKLWFSQLRAVVTEFIHLYNRYIPEVLFGKCLSNYITTNYPYSSYYEYPFILLGEIYTSIVTTVQPQPEPNVSSTDLPVFEMDLNMEQNEISNSYVDELNTSYGLKSSRELAGSPTKSIPGSENFFDFSSVLNENKNDIANAINQHSWQICVKLYTAESISRSLKMYFLSL